MTKEKPLSEKAIVGDPHEGIKLNYEDVEEAVKRLHKQIASEYDEEYIIRFHRIIDEIFGRIWKMMLRSLLGASMLKMIMVILQAQLNKTSPNIEE